MSYRIEVNDDLGKIDMKIYSVLFDYRLIETGPQKKVKNPFAEFIKKLTGKDVPYKIKKAKLEGDMAVIFRIYMERLYNKYNDSWFKIAKNIVKSLDNDDSTKIDLKFDSDGNEWYKLNTYIPSRGVDQYNIHPHLPEDMFSNNKLTVENDYFREKDSSTSKYNDLKGTFSYSYFDEIYNLIDSLNSPNTEQIKTTVKTATSIYNELIKDNNKKLVSEFFSSNGIKYVINGLKKVMDTGNFPLIAFYNLHSFINTSYNYAPYFFTFRYNENYNKMVEGTQIKENILICRKILAIYNSTKDSNEWQNISKNGDHIAQNLDTITKICDTIMNKIENFAVLTVKTRITFDFAPLMEFAKKFFQNIWRPIHYELKEIYGPDNEYESKFNNLKGMTNKFEKLVTVIEKLLIIKKFNQRYKFKCQKFDKKVLMSLVYNYRKHENYLINPNNPNNIDKRLLASPDTNDKNIGPLCVKQHNPRGYLSGEKCYNYQSLERCNNELKNFEFQTSNATFKYNDITKDIGGLNGQKIYESKAVLFNKNSNLHDKEFINTDNDIIKSLDKKPKIARTITTTTKPPTTTTTTEYVHVIEQVPETTQPGILELADPIIPDGNYYLSTVNKNGIKKYLSIFKSTENNKNYYFLKNNEESNNKNNSIFTVKNHDFPKYEGNTYKFITISFKNKEENNLFLRTETDKHKIIVIDESIDLPLDTDFNKYFLPVKNVSLEVTSDNEYNVYLRPTAALEHYCDNFKINSTVDEIYQDVYYNDSSFNYIIHKLFNLSSNNDNVPIISCNKPSDVETHFNFELHSELESQ